MNEDDERQEQSQHQKQYMTNKQKYTSQDKDLKMYCNVGHRNCISYAQQQQQHQQHLFNTDKSKLNVFSKSITTTNETQKYDIDKQLLSQQQNELSTSNLGNIQDNPQSIENCCLPPPSPAPHSDRYYNINSITTSNLSTYMDQHSPQDVGTSKKCIKIDSQDYYDQEHQLTLPKITSISTPIQRHILCNNVGKNINMTNNNNKCHNSNVNVTTNTNNFDFLKSSAAFVHTPIKRYIPTPPTSTTPNDDHQHQQPQQHHVLHVSGMLSYQRLHHNKSYATVNCCNDAQQIYEQSQQTAAAAAANELIYTTTHNHHSTSTKIINDEQQQQPQQKFSTQFTTIICNNFNNNTENDNQQQQHHFFNQQLEHQQGYSQKYKINNTTENYHMNNQCIYLQQQQQQQQQQHQQLQKNNDFNASCAVDTMTDNPSTSTSTTTTTCLHCNNVRRTAGVHQTTQTTGPVSPVQLFLPHNDNRLIDMQQQQMINKNNAKSATLSASSSSSNTSTTATIYNYQQHQQHQKKYFCIYLQQTILRFLGIINDEQEIEYEQNLWHERQKRFALRRYGKLKCTQQQQQQQIHQHSQQQKQQQYYCKQHDCTAGDLPDILATNATPNKQYHDNNISSHKIIIEKRLSIFQMLVSAISYIIINWQQQFPKYHQQWSRSFAPRDLHQRNQTFQSKILYDDLCNVIDSQYDDIEDYDDQQQQQQETILSTALRDNEAFFDTLIEEQVIVKRSESSNGIDTHCGSDENDHVVQNLSGVAGVIAGWQRKTQPSQQYNNINEHPQQVHGGYRISGQIIDNIFENSRRSVSKERYNTIQVNGLEKKINSIVYEDERYDYRAFFTYWINTVHILVLILSILCYGLAPLGFGSEERTGQVLVTSLSLQTVQHVEQRNIWIGPKHKDLVHIGAKFATCMRRDIKITQVLMKTRRQERETACCIRNDDSGCVQSSQADCSVRGLFPSKSIATWKKWSPGESGPGGRISGSVCGLDPKYCDAPASIAPYEWPDDITKWPICRKTNSFTQRFRYKDHTAEHMICEVIGHPCCTGVFGECRITTKEYCDFVSGYFHEEASLCSQISCLNNVCGMFPFIYLEIPDQIYRLLTSLCLHAGVLHLAISVCLQHFFLADLERLIGPIRTAILYIGSGLAGNLASAILVPYKPEVGPLASLAGVISASIVLLILIHWKQVHKPQIALVKLLLLFTCFFGLATLPWQLNFGGLVASTFFGTLITMSVVPFVNISTNLKNKQKTKIKLIWICIIIHIFFYVLLPVIFYVFPMEFTNINIGDVFGTNLQNASGRIFDSDQLVVMDNRLHKYVQKFND